MTFNQIEDLINEYPKTLDLLMLLVNYEVNFIETQEQMIEVTQRHRESIRTVVNKSWDKVKEETKQADMDEDNKEMESETEVKPSSSVSKHSLPSSPSAGYQIDYSHLPELQTAECGYVERECIVEAAFRSSKINGPDELDVIITFYNGFNSFEKKDRLMLIKCLTAYDRIELIDMIYELLYTKRNIYKNYKTLDKEVESRLSKKLNKKFDLIQFIGDIILHAVVSDNIVLAQRMIRKYGQVLKRKSVEIIDAVVDSLVYQFESGIMLTYPFEKLRIINDVSRLYTADTPSVLKFLSVFENLLYQTTHLNFMTNYYNPLRMYAMMIRT